MAKHGEEMNEERNSAGSQTEFFRLAGIGPELLKLMTELIENPEKFFSIPVKRRRKMENQMDAILSSFEQ